MLAHHFLRRHAKLNGKSAEQFSTEALRYLVNAPWQGNVRELSNAVERAVLMSQGNTVNVSDFFEDELPEGWDKGMEIPPTPPPDTHSFESLTLAEVEKRHILATLQALKGHRLKTAEQLEISIRTLRNKLNQYRTEGEKVDGGEEED